MHHCLCTRLRASSFASCPAHATKGSCPEGDWDFRLLCCGHEGQWLQLVHVAHEKAVGLVCSCILQLAPNNPTCCQKCMRRVAVPQSHRICRSLPPSADTTSKPQSRSISLEQHCIARSTCKSGETVPFLLREESQIATSVLARICTSCIHTTSMALTWPAKR